MKAVVLKTPCEAKDLKLTDVEKPGVKKGYILVKNKAFGINRSEIYTRQGLSPTVKLPRIIGIECVGVVDESLDDEFNKGDVVVSMMGGLGRQFNGSYAEYALIPKNQVYKLSSSLDFTTLAAIPEMYYTAYASLFEVLKLKKDDKLLIRGATSSVGLASIQLAKALGIYVIGTTRSENKLDLILNYGADEAIVDKGNLNLFNKPNKILELIGTKTLKDSLKNVSKSGIVCMTGILGGQWEFKSFLPMEDIPTGIYLSSFDSEHISHELLKQLLGFIEKNKIKPIISKVFDFEDIASAHEFMESNTANGKIVINVEKS